MFCYVCCNSMSYFVICLTFVACSCLIVVLVSDSPPSKIRRLSDSLSPSVVLSPLCQSGLPAAKHGDQPDADAIKMFIGQIPKTWGESEVRELLEVYGPIYQLNILREKGSVLSKGNHSRSFHFCHCNYCH